MRIWFVIILGIVALLAIAVLGYIAWSNRQQLKRQDRQLVDVSRELTATQEKLTAFTRGMTAILNEGGHESIALPEQPNGEHDKRKRHLRIVPPLVVMSGGVAAILRRAERHPGPVTAGASLIASTAILSMIVIGSGVVDLDGSEDQTPAHGRPPAAQPGPTWQPTGVPPPPSTLPPLPLPSSTTNAIDGTAGSPVANTVPLRAAQPPSSRQVSATGAGVQPSLRDSRTSARTPATTRPAQPSTTTTSPRPSSPPPQQQRPCLIVVIDPVLDIAICVGGTP